jgi:hypothetical protein
MAVILTATVPFESPGSYDPWPGAGPPTVNYYQRVWSTGTSVWCYYTKTVIDPSPLATETTPNWVGSATFPSVVSVG